METKAFHESFIVNLQTVKDRLLKSYTNDKGKTGDTFVIRFRLELLPLMELLIATTIPKQFISQMKEEILEFSLEFVTQYANVGPKKEMDRIKEYFQMILFNLSER